MRSTLLSFFSLSLLASPIAAQDATNPKEIYESVANLNKGERPANREEAAKRGDAVKASAQEALTKHAEVFAKGEGLYWKAKLQQLAREDTKVVAESFKAHVKAQPDSDLAQESLVLAAQILMRTPGDEATKLLGQVKEAKLSPETKKTYDMVKDNLTAAATREGLAGKTAPEIKPSNVVGGPANMTLSSLKGKVVVIDFFATWCGPCRAAIPHLVEMQEHHGKEGLQVMSVTYFYGYGSDFSGPDAKPPHGGKTVGSSRPDGEKISKEEEIRINEAFVKAFSLNYPILFTTKENQKDNFGVRGIPTVYVVDRAGKVAGHIVGVSDENKKKLDDIVKKCLNEKVPADASSAGGGGH